MENIEKMKMETGKELSEDDHDIAVLRRQLEATRHSLDEALRLVGEYRSALFSPKAILHLRESIKHLLEAQEKADLVAHNLKKAKDHLDRSVFVREEHGKL